MLEILITVAIFVGIVAAFLLYKAAHIKKEVVFQESDMPLSQTVAAGPVNVQSRQEIETTIRRRISKLPTAADENTVKVITEIVEQQAQELVKDMRQEYDVKYQVAVQEKDKEVDAIKKRYQDVQKKFDQVEQDYKRVDDEKKTTEMVVKSIADGLVVVNAKGEVLLMNPAAEKILGAEKSAKIGKPLTDNLPDELMVSLSKESRDTGEKMIEFKSKDENVKKVLRSSSAVIQNEHGQTVGMVNILTDITKQRELDDLKNKFVSNITHEFRTPIVAMQKAMAVLSSQQPGPLNDTQSNFLNIVSRNLVHLSRLVEDLLDMSRIDSGKLLLRPVPTRLDRVITDVCDTLDTWAKSKNLEIVRDLDKSLPEIVVDPDKLVQVMNNLIGNAIKFTKAGKITVKTGWHTSGNYVQVSVSDTGCGIAPENIGKLFKRFEQFGDQQGIIGTGLGLSITKEIVEKHGGQISATSEHGKGSCFLFTLPLKQK